MDVSVSLSADETMPGGNEDIHVTALGFESLRVSMPGEARANGDEEAGADYQCGNCGERLSPPDNNGTEFYRAMSNGDSACPAYDGSDPDEPHEPEFIPGSFANSAQVVVDDDDSVTVTISVGDPRGAFAMTVRRNDAGELFLSVPHPSDGWPHMTLTEIHGGYYRIGD